MRNMVSEPAIRSPKPVAFVAFWTAATLPFLYLPLLLSGLAGRYLDVFLVLLAVNIVALILGHRYAR